MTFKSIENAFVVQTKDVFSARFLLLNECTFVYLHTEKDGFFHLAEVQSGENSLWNNFSVHVNLHQFFHFSVRRNNSTGIF